MNLATFVRSLYADGRVRLPLVGAAMQESQFAADDLREAHAVLNELDAVERLDFPYEAPEFSLRAAEWSARMLYRACQFAVDRDVAAEVVSRVLGEPCPEPMCPSAVYSVDLVFRFLPDVRRHLKAMPEDDPAVTAVMRWAAEWPLSSVSMSGVSPTNVTIISRHHGLRRKYTDRIMAAGDIERANDPEIRAAVEEATGAHPGLAGSFLA